ncbi:hypothetical protein ERJ75_001380800 [Trypanosoma vivax]|nr:hypothetical protein ERJ75_001380800 [Trypanosoma vivax]
MKRFWTSLLGFASLLALLSANKAQGGAAKGVKRSSAQGACSFATALDAVARAAELAATEAAERSHNASAWQEALATALSKTNNATALKALGSAANMQGMNAQVGAVALSLAREAQSWAVDIRSAVFAFSALSGGGEEAALCISKENDSNETADFSNHGEEYAFDAICGPKPAEVEALARRHSRRVLGRCSTTRRNIAEPHKRSDCPRGGQAVRTTEKYDDGSQHKTTTERGRPAP